MAMNVGLPLLAISAVFGIIFMFPTTSPKASSWEIWYETSLKYASGFFKPTQAKSARILTKKNILMFCGTSVAILAAFLISRHWNQLVGYSQRLKWKPIVASKTKNDGSNATTAIVALL